MSAANSGDLLCTQLWTGADIAAEVPAESARLSVPPARIGTSTDPVDEALSLPAAHSDAGSHPSSRRDRRAA